MSNKWRRDGHRERFIFDETWAVKLDGARWYVYRDGRALLVDYKNAQDAIEAAEKIMGAK